MPKTKLYRFKVNGGSVFPVDMLRYDRCWPHGGEDAAQLQERASCDGARENRKLYEGQGHLPPAIELMSNQPPTVGRWSSFLWAVGSVTEVR